MATTIGKAQFAVGRWRSSELGVLQIDAVSVFNSIDRARVLRRVHECVPHLPTFVKGWLTSKSKAVLSKADENTSILKITNG